MTEMLSIQSGPLGRALWGHRTLRETIERHDNNYTLVRLVLAASVIYFHSFALTSAGGHVDSVSALMWPVTDVGGLAVKLFFFLSGLFVTQSFHKNHGLLDFVLKRFLRIWPGYFVCLLVTAILLAVIAGQGSPWYYLKFHGLYDYVLRNSAFKLTWEIDGVLTSNRLQSVNGPIHTLPMEAKMYVLLAGLGAIGLLRTPGRIVVAGVAALAIALWLNVRGVFPNWFFDADWSFSAGMMFLAGVALYGVSAWLKPALWQGAVLLLMLMLASGAAYILAFYAVAVWLMLMIGQSRILGRFVQPHKDWSYGIYIYGWPSQQIVLAVVSQTLQPSLLSVLALAVAAIFAALSWRFVEKPAIELGKHFSAVDWTRSIVRYRRFLSTLVGLVVLCVAARSIADKWGAGPVQLMAATIKDFGPHESRVGEPINLQPGGNSAIWIKLEGPVPGGTVVVMDGRRLESHVAVGLATAKVDAVILASPGEKKIFLEHRSVSGVERSNEVLFRVTP